MNFCHVQSIPTEFLASNIEIIPNYTVINSTSTTNFLCINHQFNNSRLEASLSKSIPSNQMKISTTLLNETTMHIQLESNNYVGIFHLLCYSHGEQSKGIYADVIVKAAPGVLQLTERCRVYDRQYIKCIIGAPIIAKAIQNGYPPDFKFKEMNHPSDRAAYIQPHEFLKNESTNEYLIFKWKPTVEGEFPNGVRMNMTAMLQHFVPSYYYFDMTPIFQIKPKFILQALSSSQIQINLTSISPPPFCEKSIVPQLTSNINQTWTAIESDRNSILVNDLLSDSIYRVCIKCRQVYNDPAGLEECQEIKTLSKINLFFNQKYFIISLIISIVIVFIIIGFIAWFWYKRRETKYTTVDKHEIILNTANPNRYDLDPTPFTTSHISIDTTDEASAPVFVDNDTVDVDDDPIINGEPKDYLSIASINCVLEASYPKFLSPSEN